MTDVADKPVEAKPRRERRRKETAEGDFGLKLPIPNETRMKYPKSQFVLRWFRDEDARIKIMHGQDWDPVEGVDPVPGATDRHGNPCEHVLLVKQRDWYEADRAPKEEMRKETERRAEKGEVVGQGDGAGESLDESVRYTGNNQLS